MNNCDYLDCHGMCCISQPETPCKYRSSEEAKENCSAYFRLHSDEKVYIRAEVTTAELFRALCKSLMCQCVLDEDFLEKYSFTWDEDDEMVVYKKANGEICDDRGELIYHLHKLAKEIFPGG